MAPLETMGYQENREKISSQCTTPPPSTVDTPPPEFWTKNPTHGGSETARDTQPPSTQYFWGRPPGGRGLVVTHFVGFFCPRLA